MAGPLSSILMNTFKFSAVLFRERELREFLLWMATDWQEIKCSTERDIMMNSAKLARRFIKISMFFAYGGGMLISTIAPVTQKRILVRNISMRPLNYPGYYVFFDPYVSSS